MLKFTNWHVSHQWKKISKIVSYNFFKCSWALFFSILVFDCTVLWKALGFWRPVPNFLRKFCEFCENAIFSTQSGWNEKWLTFLTLICSRDYKEWLLACNIDFLTLRQSKFNMVIKKLTKKHHESNNKFLSIESQNQKSLS